MINFKKIVSILASGVMLASTISFAAAANLYPKPFTDGAAIVYGTVALPSDMVGAIDIYTQLKDRATGATDATVSGGDSYKLEKTSTKFQLGDAITDVVSAAVTDDKLPILLADGVYTDTDNTDFDYTQTITLSAQNLSLFEDNDYKADLPTIGIRIANGANVLSYTLDFSDEPLWADLESTDLTIMGKTYYVLDAVNSTSLTLLDSADSIEINEGESTPVTVGDKTYTVSAKITSGTEVKLTVDGEVTKTLDEGDTRELLDGSYVGIKDIMYNSKETGISSVEFSIGKGKLVIEDGVDVEINDDSIPGLSADLTSAAEKLESIELIWAAEDDLFVTTDSEITMPGFNAVKLSFSGMTYPAEEKIAVDVSTDYVILKDFPLKDTTESINILYGSNGVWQGIGKDSDNLLKTSSGTTVTFDVDDTDYVVASWTDGNDAESYLIKAINFKTETVDKVTIQYKKAGVWVDLKTDANDEDDITIGNVEIETTTINNSENTVILTSTAGTFNTLYSKEGMKVYLPYTAANTTNTGVINFTTSGPIGHDATSFYLVFSEEDLNENIGAGSNITATLGWNSATTKEAHVSAVSGGGASDLEIGETDKWINDVYSALATEYIWDKSGDQYTLELTYHGEESYGNVYLTSSSAIITPGTTGVAGGQIVIVKDSEVSAVASKNLIIVGGSCVNTVAAKILNSDAPLCGADFSLATKVGAGGYIIKTVDAAKAGGTAGKVAMLVAGYNAADTTNAVKRAMVIDGVKTDVGSEEIFPVVA